MDDNLKEKSTWGGKRPNAGRPEGSKNSKTIDNEIVEDEIRQRVLRGKEALINAQFNLATGVAHLFVIETETDVNGKKTKKRPRLVEDQQTIENYLNGDYEGEDDYYYITTKLPDNKAIDSLIDRTIGKSMQRTDVTSGGKEFPQPIINVLPINNSDQKDN